MGEYSTLTVTTQVNHVVPRDGRISIIFPKWNYFADRASLLESFVSVSTSPGQVGCNAINGFSGLEGSNASNLYCQFTQNYNGRDEDLLEVIMELSDVTADIPAGS